MTGLQNINWVEPTDYSHHAVEPSFGNCASVFTPLNKPFSIFPAQIFPTVYECLISKQNKET